MDEIFSEFNLNAYNKFNKFIKCLKIDINQ